MSRMNANIILAGQQPDIIGSFARGQEARARADQFQNENAMRQLFQTQGADILAGDTNALNALAQYDPRQALAIQGQHQANARATQTHEMRIAEYVRGLDANAAAQEAAKVEAGLTRAIGAYQAGDLNGVNQILQSAGEQPIQSLDQFPAIAAAYGDVLGKLKEVQAVTAGPKPADEYQRYVQEEQAAGRQPLGRIEYAQAKKGKGTVVYDPETGQPLVSIGGGGLEPPKLTVDAGKNTGFLIRLNDAQEILNSLESEGLSFFQQNAENVPLGIGNYFVSEEFQRFDQARRDFVNAILRRESGAVISDQEFDNAEKQYFPVPGDSEAVIAQKRQNRQNAIEGVRAGSGEGAGYAEKLRNQQPEPTPEAVDSGSQPQFQFENDQQRQLFEKYAVPNG